MNRKQLLAGAGLCVVILWAVFAAGGVRLGSSAAGVPGATSQTADGALAAQPLAPDQLAAAAAQQPSNAGVAVQAQAQPEAAQRNLAAQPAQPTAVPAAPAATATAGTSAPGEAAETPEAGEAAETPEPTEVAGAPEPGESADHDGDKVEQGETGGTDTDNDAEQADHETADAQALAAQARITQQQAEQTVLAAHPGTTVVKTELDEKDGTVIYKVKLSNDTKVKVNAITGAILSTDTPDNDGSDH
jgi:hypothetical protein